MGIRDLIEWKPLRDWHAVPSRNERLVDRARGLFFVRRREVVATQEVHSDVLEEQRPEGMLGVSASVAYVATDPRTASISKSAAMFAPNATSTMWSTPSGASARTR